MALPPLAPVSALEIRLGLMPGTLADADLARAGAALDDVSALVRAEAGSPLVESDGITIDAPDAVVAITLSVSLRVYLNPDGLQGYSVEGYSEQRPQGGIGPVLTDDERAAITTAMRTAAGGGAGYLTIGSVRTPSAYSAPAAADPLTIWIGP